MLKSSIACETPKNITELKVPSKLYFVYEQGRPCNLSLGSAQCYFYRTYYCFFSEGTEYGQGKKLRSLPGKVEGQGKMRRREVVVVLVGIR